MAAPENREQRTERATSARRSWEKVEGFEKNTKDTKDHEGSQRLPEWGVQVRSIKPSTATADYAD